MGKIKGRYVAQVVIDINIDEALFVRPELILPIERLKKKFYSDLDKELEKLIADDLFMADEGTVSVTKQYCDLYMVEDEE